MKKNVIPITTLLFLLSFAYIQTAGAQTIVFPNPLTTGTNTLGQFFLLIINSIVIPIGGVLSVFFIIYSGFLFVTARGNETKLKTAKQSLLWGAIGAGIILGSWAIANAIQGTISQLING